MTTTADLIAATERLLFSGAREETNYLAAEYTAAGTTITLAYPAGGIQAGARIAIGLEMFRVKESPAGSVVTVTGAQEGSAPANHLTGAPIIVNPKYSPWSILGAINSELAALSSPSNGLFQMLTADITFDTSIEGYDLGTSTFLDVYELQWKLAGSSKAWPNIDDWSVDRNMLTTDFASGTALFIDGAGDTRPIRVKYKVGFTALSTLTDNVLTVSGLPLTAHDIPPYGAADILVTAGEVRRNALDAQGDSKRLAEVPAGAQRQAAGGLRQIHDRRVREEASRLRVAYPRRRTW